MRGSFLLLDVGLGFDVSGLGWCLNRFGLLCVFDKPRADGFDYFLWEVLGSNTFGDFVRHRVGGHTYVDAFASRVLHDFLVIELQLFSKIVDSNLLTCWHTDPTSSPRYYQCRA
jgi:hypothetical protein